MTDEERRRNIALEIQHHGGNVPVPPAPADPMVPAPPQNPITPYTSDSSADQLRSSAAPERQGGGYNGTPQQQTIYNPPPAPAAPPNTINGISTVSPATPVQLDTRQADESRAAQYEAIDRVRKRLNGESPSLAQTQLQNTLNANIAQQQSMAAGARGMAVASARRNAARNIGMLNQGAGAQFAGLRAQEETADINTLAGVAGQTRGQDIQVATGNAELDVKIKDIESRFRLGLIDAATRNRALDEEIRHNREIERHANEQMKLATTDAERQHWSNVAKSAGSAALVIGAMIFGPALLSDERMKENVSATNNGAIDDFINSVRPVSYDYRPEAGQRPGRRHGFMAQDLERSEIGKSLVVDRGDGTKVIDVATALGPVMVALKHVNDKAERAIAARRKAAREMA